MFAKDYDDLFVHQAGYEAAMRIFELSKTWPKVERYALTDQIRRSSRGVCVNITEAWCKRRYERHFVSKLSDAEAEAAETMNWLQFARDCGYLGNDTYDSLRGQYHAIRSGLVKMMRAPEKWCGPSNLAGEPEPEYGPLASSDTSEPAGTD